MSARLLLLTEVPVKAEDFDKTAQAWLAHNAAAITRHTDTLLYRSLEDNLLVALTPISSLAELADQHAGHHDLAASIAPALVGDFRRQVVEFVEAPKDTDAPLPSTPYIQLRHVEVKPQMYEAYREWRERTIFDVVRTHDEIEVFLAYHSLLSTEPGVLFLSGFRVDPKEYLAVFASPAYQEIVKQAGDTYITDRGLYTRIYARVEES